MPRRPRVVPFRIYVDKSFEKGVNDEAVTGSDITDPVVPARLTHLVLDARTRISKAIFRIGVRGVCSLFGSNLTVKG